MKKLLFTKSLLLVLSLTAIISLTGCSDKISKSEYDEVLYQKKELKKQVNTLSKSSKKLREQVDDLEKQNEALESELKDIKKKCEPYLELSAAEAEAEKAKQELKAENDRLELEELKAKEVAEQEVQEKKEKEEAEKKEKKGYDTGITYDQLARTPDDYNGEKVKFKGKVIQVIESDMEIQIRFAIDNDYDKVLLCGYSPDTVTSRILEDDTITIYGKSVGLTSYQSTLGGTITIPTIWIDKIEQ